MPEFTRNHYVPEWFQKNFLPGKQPGEKFYYLDKNPKTRINNGHRYTRRSVLKWGPPSCFCIDDLYTTKLGRWTSTEIEEKFFGPIDREGKEAVSYFSEFVHPSANGELFHKMLQFMSIQKLRTPKGLSYLEDMMNTNDRNELLLGMQEFEKMHCAIWTECIWTIADASQSPTKFILSDHPITVYNKSCFPDSRYCRGHRDPEVWLTGTQTIFPLNLNKALLLTNLSWVRNPYGSPLKSRPNPTLFRDAMFDFTDIQTGRLLSEEEVIEINFIVKSRALRYIAAANKDWLYPEYKMQSKKWDRLGGGYLLMPDPRSTNFTGEFIAGFKSKTSFIVDEYGLQPGQPGFKDERRREKEWDTHLAFQGEFARVFGPKRRGMGYEFGDEQDRVDSPEYHTYHLSLESLKPKHRKRRKGKAYLPPSINS